MPKARTPEVKEKPKWILIFNKDREGELICPICNNVEPFNIIQTPSFCPRCKKDLEGFK